jgi:uncharacterized protein (DUF1800 family)
MNLKRFAWVGAAIVAVGLGWMLLVPYTVRGAAPDATKVIHAIERLSYGPTPGEIDRVKRMGVEAYIQSQLNPDSIALPAQLTQKLDRLETLELSPVALASEYSIQNNRPNNRPNNNAQNNRRQDRQNRQNRQKERQERQPQQQTPERTPTEQEQQMARERERVPLQQAQQAHLLRSLNSPRQLEEVMVDFWYNHFNVSSDKGFTRVWVGSYENSAIRPHALGKFRDLLAATARHPAMLFYLDNWRNTDPNSSKARGQFRGINENYARELMELHTLGVDGGYNQKDVVELARILTGWGIDRTGNNGDSGFYFDRDRHDNGTKVLLGQSIAGSGEAEVEQALDILARHPSTAEHISYKLAQYFVADTPPDALVQTLKQRFIDTDGDIRQVLATLFESPEFWDEKSIDRKFKTPYQYVVSVLRAANAIDPDARRVLGEINNLGMPLYRCQTPDGYPNTQDRWLNSDATLRRLSLATTIARGRFSGNRPIEATQLAQTLGNHFSKHTQETIDASAENLRSALILGSPEMMYR